MDNDSLTTPELNIDWDLLQTALKNDVRSFDSINTSSLMSSTSPRLSPISTDSSSPYLLRKVRCISTSLKLYMWCVLQYSLLRLCIPTVKVRVGNDQEIRKKPPLRKSSPEKHNVRPGAPSEPNEYNFNYRRRGLFVIINNKNFSPSTGQLQREGTDNDAERLEETFQDTGFEVRRYDDVSGAKMTKLMYEAAAYDHSDCDCFGCAILSHGREGFVYATDRLIPLEALTVPFKGDRCPTLVGKPKLFFIQACRGAKLDHGVDVVDTGSVKSDDGLECSSVPCRKVPVEADFLFSYSTVPGYYSWRNNQDGSWYIQALCIVLANYGNKMELVHMLTQVNRIVAYEFESCTDEEFTDKAKQMPSIVSMLTRYVHFRPKKPDIRG